MMNWKNSTLAALIFVMMAGWLCIHGCSGEDPLGPALSENEIVAKSSMVGGDEFDQAIKKGVDVEFQDGSVPPGGLVAIDCFGQQITCWPFTGRSFDGEAVDPVNLVFVGEADPVQIRAALLALDGDRTAFGFPAASPFDEVWADAIGGDVETAYAENGGWLGSVIQLTLGDYGPIRFHLRLFRTQEGGNSGRTITLGGAHFELMIPGTADHQVLSWEIAEQLVVVDMMRCGLLDPDQPMMPTGAINPAPGFRTIMPEIYNGLPPELIALIGGPTPPVDDPVDIPTDGQGTVINLASSATVIPGQFTSGLTVVYDQYVPRPFCSVGPGDWLYVQGPVEFFNTATINQQGRYSYHGGFRGELTAVPIDINTGEPLGPAFSASVHGDQHGWLSDGNSLVKSFDKRLTHEAGGPQILFTGLHVPEHGKRMFQSFNRCLDGDELLAN